VLLATFWIKFSQPFTWLGMTFAAIPVGLVVGLIIVSQFEKFQANRKIWYAVIIVVGIISYFEPAGIVI
jgi:multisubunit Na+/H+ antiporter MnhE subunit